MSKVLLLSTSIQKSERSEDVDSHYPIGLGYIHSFLEYNNHKVDTLFLNNLSFKDCMNSIQSSINKNEPDIIGFQILSFNRVSSFLAIEYIHNKYPNIKIVIGGIHTSILYEQILEKYPFVIAVIGEGEYSLLEICNGKNIDDIEGIAYIKNNKVFINKERQPIENLDLLPYPSHKSFIGSTKTLAGLLTSRGCPFKCSFCCLDCISKNKVRYRSPKNVVEEILYIQNNFPQINRIWIHDDSFLLNNKRAIEICKLIIDNKIHLKFTCSARIKPLSKELISWLEKANFDHILFGLESGAESVLEKTNKKVIKDDFVKAVKLFKNSPINITLFLIVGLPGETLETVLETSFFVKELQKEKYIFFDDIGVINVYPGTQIYEICKKNNFLDDSYWMSDKDVPRFTLENSNEKLLEYKELLRSHISLTKIDTKEGYKNQKDVLKYVDSRFNINQSFLQYLKNKYE